MSLNQNIKDAIVHNLPAMVAGELQTYLAGMAHLEDVVEARGEKITELEKLNADLLMRVKQDAAISQRENEVKVREEAVEKKERDVKITLLEGELASKKSENAQIMELARTVFKNPVLTTQSYGNVSTPTGSQPTSNNTTTEINGGR